MRREKIGSTIPTRSVDSSRLIHSGNIEITQSPFVWNDLAERFKVPVREIQFIDFNRSGVCLPQDEVRVSFRARFIATVDKVDQTRTWFALPVRGPEETHFVASKGSLRFKEYVLANIGEVFLDTCDVSYQRGPNLLNLNSRSRGSCGGCTACVHNYKDLYDETVLKDQRRLTTREGIEKFFQEKESKGLNIASLQQIAVVTGLFGSEKAVVQHMQMIAETVRLKGFKGELMYFGCEVNSEEALQELANLGKFVLIYAIDNFTKREELLAKKKSGISIDIARDTLERARKYGIDTTFAYIAGIDTLREMEKGFLSLRAALSKFPIINIFQVQTPGQLSAMNPEAKRLEYYIRARKTLESILAETALNPRRWENYRPLWYETYNGRPLPRNTFGD